MHNAVAQTTPHSILWHSDKAVRLKTALPVSHQPSFQPIFTALVESINSLTVIIKSRVLNMYYDDECETCDREFCSQQAAIQHMNALDHWGPRYECDTCSRGFFTESSADQHMDDTGHRQPQFECDTCNRRFHTQLSTNQHMDALNHHLRHHCHDCNREFQSENALKMVCFYA